MGNEVTCELRKSGKVVAKASQDGNSEVVARNGAVMKLMSQADWDGEQKDGFNLRCK